MKSIMGSYWFCPAFYHYLGFDATNLVEPGFIGGTVCFSKQCVYVLVSPTAPTQPPQSQAGYGSCSRPVEWTDANLMTR